MRRLFILALSAVLFVALASAALAAPAPKFRSTSSSVNSSGALVVSWDERGVGHANIDYSVTADATATYACINKGGKNPSAANKRTVAGKVGAIGTFAATKNGRVVGSLTAGPVSPGDFSCPKGQRLRLAAVSYSSIVLTDTTNGVSADVGNASRTLLAI